MVAVGTWNLENLYRPGGEFGPKTQDAYDAKLALLAATITTLAPEVLAVQEVGDPAALDDLVDRLPGSWSMVLSEHPDARGIRVGFLTTLPVMSTTQLTDFPPGVAPGAGRRQPGGHHLGDGPRRFPDPGRCRWGGLGSVTVHLKSKLLTFPGGRFTPATRTNGPGSGPAPCTGGPPKPRRSRCTPTRCWEGRGRTGH